MVSARSPIVVGTEELKLAAWYMIDSREEAHCMLPPRDSSDSSILSAVRVVVDCICKCQPRLKQAPFTVQAYLEGQTIDYMADTSEALVLIS